jgi:hypothetical protein
MQFKRILGPADFSDFSGSALDYGLTVAEYCKAHWLAPHSIESSKYHAD